MKNWVRYWYKYVQEKADFANFCFRKKSPRLETVDVSADNKTRSSNTFCSNADSITGCGVGFRQRSPRRHKNDLENV